MDEGPSPAAQPTTMDDAVAIANGLFGDTLEARASSLAIPMAFRVGGRVLPLDRDGLAGVLAAGDVEATSRICLLVHGLMSNESIFEFRDDPATNYGTLLADRHELTVVSVRYNTGRQIATNGRQLAEMLQQLVRVWPVRVHEIDLIGHSMGGLVIRSACHHGRRVRPTGRRLPLGRRWTSKVRRIVLIGTPNTGAALAGLVESAAQALLAFPIAAIRMAGTGLDRRSAGIKDLREGEIVEPGTRVRSLRWARQLAIVGSVTARTDHALAQRLGDALVTTASATGVTADGELLPGVEVRTFPRVTHNALAHHPGVGQAIADWW